MLKQVLVPLDGSELAEKALRYARDITEPSGKIVLLTAVDVPEYAVPTFYPIGAVADVPDSGTMIERLVPQANQYLDKIAASLQEDGWQVQTESVVGEPAYAIIEKAEELNVDAIVMSTHGRSGISRWLFGSVTSKVLGSVDCPVFVIPSRES